MNNEEILNISSLIDHVEFNINTTIVRIISELSEGRAYILKNELSYAICNDPTSMKLYEIKTVLIEKELEQLEPPQLEVLWLETDNAEEYYENTEEYVYDTFDIREYLFPRLNFYKYSDYNDDVFLKLLDDYCLPKTHNYSNKYKPDYGLALKQDGISSEVHLNFYDFPLASLTMFGNGLFSTMVEMPLNGEIHALSLDFNKDQLDKLLSDTRSASVKYIKQELSQDPYTPRTIDFDANPIKFDLVAKLGKLQTNNKENFIPLVLQEILSKKKLINSLSKQDYYPNKSQHSYVKTPPKSKPTINATHPSTLAPKYKSTDRDKEASMLEKNKIQINIFKNWLRWILLPIVSIGGAYLGFFLFMLIQGIHPANGGSYLDMITWLIIPIVGKGIFGYIFGLLSYTIAPKGKITASTVMITLLALTNILEIILAFYNINYSFSVKIQILIGDIVLVSSAIYTVNMLDKDN